MLTHTYIIYIFYTFQLEAFSNPQLKTLCETNNKSLIETKNVLDDVREKCCNLEKNLIEKDGFYEKREKDLQEINLIELNKGNNYF